VAKNEASDSKIPYCVTEDTEEPRIGIEDIVMNLHPAERIAGANLPVYTVNVIRPKYGIGIRSKSIFDKTRKRICVESQGCKLIGICAYTELLVTTLVRIIPRELDRTEIGHDAIFVTIIRRLLRWVIGGGRGGYVRGAS